MRRPFIVAELSCNHGGSLDTAMQLVKDCATAGADAIKLQTWTPGTMVLDRSLVIESGPWAGRNMAELYEQAFTPWEWHEPLFSRARSLGMIGFSSVFDTGALEFLESIHCPMYKIASFEIVDLALILYVRSTGKPIIISTGMASLGEINRALLACEPQGPPITMLICASAYPAKAEDYDLRKRIPLARYGPWGLSDHTRGVGVGAAAAALGAEVIEKHVTPAGYDSLDKAFSATPDEFAAYVAAIRDVATCSPDGDCPPGSFKAGPSEAPQVALRRSLYFAKAMKAGDTITLECLTTARPAHGMACSEMAVVIDRKVAIDIQAGQPVTSKVLI